MHELRNKCMKKEVKTNGKMGNNQGEVLLEAEAKTELDVQAIYRE